jgi:hypothetical protein
MGSPVDHTAQIDQLRAFITANTVVDHVETAPAVIPPFGYADGTGDGDVSVASADRLRFPLVHLALAWVGDELHAVAAGDSALDAIGQLACAKLFSGRPCPCCFRPQVFFDGLSPLFTFDPADESGPWDEYICPIFFDPDLAIYRRACEKTDGQG